MTLEAYKPSERYASQAPTSVLLWGQSGCGKTRTASSFPSVLAADIGIEEGLVSTRDKKDLVALIIGTWDQMMELQVTLPTLVGKHNARTFVCDGLTTAYEVCLRAAAAEFKKPYPTLHEHGVASDRMRKWVGDLKVACRRLGIHLVCTALEQSIKDEVLGTVKGTPDIARKLGEEIGGLFDLNLHMKGGYDAATGRVVRQWWTVTDGIYASKDRWGVLKPVETSQNPSDPFDLYGLLVMKSGGAIK